MSLEILAQIDAPDSAQRKGFNCGIVLVDDRVVEAADIVKYMRGWSRVRVRDYCKARGYKVTVVTVTERNDL